MELVYKEESRFLLGLAMQLHKELGCGFKEKIYQDAFEILLNENNIHDFYYDFLCWDKIGVEIKAMDCIIGEHEAQIINYLHVSNHKLGVIFNFGATSLQYKWFPNIWHYRISKDIQS